MIQVIDRYETNGGFLVFVSVRASIYSRSPGNNFFAKNHVGFLGVGL